jgi:hypothetical protein
MINRIIFTSLVCMLAAGCGVEVASTAATAASLQAASTKQALAQQEEIKKKLDEAMKTAASAASRAGDQ